MPSVSFPAPLLTQLDQWLNTFSPKAEKKPAYATACYQLGAVRLTLYPKGTLVVQGKEAQQWLDQHWPPPCLQTEAHGGSDESGKGDLFGPLCVAAVYLTQQQCATFRSMGLQDSKKMTRSAIQKLAKTIQSTTIWQAVVLTPYNYNQRYGLYKNVNTLLADLHTRVLFDITQKQPTAPLITDQFASKETMQKAFQMHNFHPKQWSQQTRAEEHPAVAASAVLARNAFEEWFTAMQQQHQVTLPKGAGPQTLAALRCLKQKQLPLENFVKMHFKSVKAVD